MYYHTPNINRYIDIIVKFRVPVILFYLLFAVVMATFYPPKFLSSDALFWLKGSQELHKTQSKQFSTHYLSKLTVKVDAFDETSHEALEKLHEQLVELYGVVKVSSLFSNDFVETKIDSNESEMLTVVNAGDLDTLQLLKLVKELHNDYCNVVEDDFKTFYYFISGQKSIDISKLDIPGTYEYQSNDAEIDWQFVIAYVLIFFLIMVVIFRLLYRNYIAFFSAVLVIGLSTILTFTLIVMFTGIDTIHIAMPFITISIALVDHRRSNP